MCDMGKQAEMRRSELHELSAADFFGGKKVEVTWGEKMVLGFPVYAVQCAVCKKEIATSETTKKARWCRACAEKAGKV